MNISFEDIPSYRIAYIRQIGPYGTSNVQAMEKLKNWAKSNNLFNDKSIIFGIAHDNPETTKAEDCRYDTCVVISDEYCVNEEYINQGNIIGGNYAVLKISHTAEAVQKAWIDMFPNLLKQGYHFDETRPILERYIVEMVNNHFCEICVPIY
ncbi:AraC family transcriptional regulator [Pseudobacteroides cellulosolvens]|uniref:Transcription activator effector binding protein n=1 Tax=Pseudobacteroides cellulosolvens ATCC 35603 = DSM 2933 TaxID=398512 RepID=A0A0L6JRR8_9FIRM|nr:GyrI-like domain-containing protein [Pseudobacteroides cellulosolvens]KNY28536.1 transcription activator effector binding protein [Pseudobacteroides cellulosolvens ATCC 35603 = DSM 2933]